MQQQRISGERCCIGSVLPQKHPIWSSASYRICSRNLMIVKSARRILVRSRTGANVSWSFMKHSNWDKRSCDVFSPSKASWKCSIVSRASSICWRIAHSSGVGTSQLISPRTTSDWMIRERILAHRSALNVDHLLVTTSWSNLWGTLSLKAGESEAACALSSFAVTWVECSKCPIITLNFLITSAHPGTPLAKWISIQRQHQTWWVTIIRY